MAETKSITQRPAWQALAAHYQQIKDVHLKTLFAQDATRGERFTAQAVGLYLDYSKNRITDETLRLLVALAEESGLRAAIDAMFRGDKINITEDRAVLHVGTARRRAARASSRRKTSCPRYTLCSTRCPISPRVCATGDGKDTPAMRIRTVVNIGIGGSDLARSMAYEALRHYSQRDLTFRFVSTWTHRFRRGYARSQRRGTLFIVSSKTFTTQETIGPNAHTRARLDAGWRSGRPGHRRTSSPYRPRHRQRRTGSAKPPNWPKLAWLAGRAAPPASAAPNPAGSPPSAWRPGRRRTPLRPRSPGRLQVGSTIAPARRPASSFMTDGILLAETRHDRRLRQYDALIIEKPRTQPQHLISSRYLKTSGPTGPISRSSSVRYARSRVVRPGSSARPRADRPGRRSDRGTSGSHRWIPMRNRPHVVRAVAWMDEPRSGRGTSWCSAGRARNPRRGRTPCAGAVLSGPRFCRVCPVESWPSSSGCSPSAAGGRIVLATNVAETSLTIPASAT